MNIHFYKSFSPIQKRYLLGEFFQALINNISVEKCGFSNGLKFLGEMDSNRSLTKVVR